jgi:hypothetical protein
MKLLRNFNRTGFLDNFCIAGYVEVPGRWHSQGENESCKHLFPCLIYASIPSNCL